MAFKLAEAFVEIKSKHQEADRGIDKIVKGMKLIDVEAAKLQKTTAKAFLTMATGIGSATAGIIAAAAALRDLVGKMVDAARAGQSVGEAIARWAHEITGLRNAVISLDQAQARGASISAGIASPGPRPQAISGITSEQNSEFNARRAAMNQSLIMAQQEQNDIQNIARKEMAAKKLAASANPLVVNPGGAANGLSEATQLRLDAANQQVQRVELAMKHLGFEIEETVKANTDATFEQMRVTKAQKEFGDMVIGKLNPHVNELGQGLAALSNLFAQGEFAAVVALARGGRAVGRQARDERIERQDSILRTMNPVLFDLGVQLGKISSVLAVRAGMAPGGDVNELPEGMVDIGGPAPAHRGRLRSRKESQMMGADEFSRAMLTGTAGGQKDQDLKQRHKEQIDALKQIDKSIKETANGVAVFADGGAVA